MKHLDKFGRIESQEIRNLIAKIESLIEPLFESVDAVEASVLCRHLEGTISYLAAKRCLMQAIEEETFNAF